MPRKRNSAAQVVGLAACAAFGWALYQLGRSVDCDRLASVSCPSDWVLAALAGGLVVAIVTIFFGGRLVLSGIFLAGGVGALAAGLQVQNPDGRLTFLLLGGVFTLVGLLPLLLLPFGLAKRRKAQRLLEHGVTAIGTVTAVHDTGVTVNMNPRVTVTVRIEPRDGSSVFDGSKTFVASRLSPPYVGQRFPVWYDRADPQTFMLGADVTPDASPAVQQLFREAQAGDPHAKPEGR